MSTCEIHKLSLKYPGGGAKEKESSKRKGWSKLTTMSSKMSLSDAILQPSGTSLATILLFLFIHLWGEGN